MSVTGENGRKANQTPEMSNEFERHVERDDKNIVAYPIVGGLEENNVKDYATKTSEIQVRKCCLIEPVISFFAILVFAIGYALHVKYDLRFEFVTHLISSPYIREPVSMFLYLGAWMSTCITVIVSRIMPVKRYWFWQLFILFGMSLSSSVILTKVSFGVLSLSRINNWFLSYSIMLLIINIPIISVIYIFKKRKGAKL